MRRARAVFASVLVLAAVATGPACTSSRARARGSEEVLRLGIYPNLTHAPGFVALGSGILQRELAPTRVDLETFPSGSEAGTALLAGALDGAYLGPAAVAELYQRSHGIAVVSGAVGGGAALVVRDGAGIDGPGDLRGRRVAVPAIANTQDVALRTWLHDQGLEAKDAGGDVTVLAASPTELPVLFRQGRVDAAWAPAHWPELLVDGGVGTVMVDEASLWPDGAFASTYLVVNQRYLDAHPAVVDRLVRANVEALVLIADDPDRAIELTRRGIEDVGGPHIPLEVAREAWARLTFSWDPLPDSLQANAERAYELGYLEEPPGDILRVYRLGPLDRILADMDLPTVEPPT